MQFRSILIKRFFKDSSGVPTVKDRCYRRRFIALRAPIRKQHLRDALVPILLGFAMAASSSNASELVESKEIVEIVESAEPEPLFEFKITTAWDSRYVSEGRDNLDGDSLFGATIEAAYVGLPFGAITFGTWYAWTPASRAYSELNIWAEYRFEIGNFEAYAGYTHLRFYPFDVHENEIGAGAAYGLPLDFTVGGDCYYSFFTDGSFFELFLERECKVAQWLLLTPTVFMGFNAGYRPEGHDGANNVTAVLDATVPINDNIEVAGYVAYNWAIDSDAARHPGDESLKDFFFGGVGLSLSF